jgi:hypothetical protein
MATIVFKLIFGRLGTTDQAYYGNPYKKERVDNIDLKYTWLFVIIDIMIVAIWIYM